MNRELEVCMSCKHYWNFWCRRSKKVVGKNDSVIGFYCSSHICKICGSTTRCEHYPLKERIINE